ncbi:hypothetical protein ACNKU7_12095 [Microbulbifer sp. SA54]
MNDGVLPFDASQELPVIRILTDLDTECYGKLELHDNQMYLSVNEIKHAKTKDRHCLRMRRKTILQAFYQPSLLCNIYGSIEELHNQPKTHRTPF